MTHLDHALSLSPDAFATEAAAARAAHPGTTLRIPVAVRLLQDQLTPVLAYRRLVAHDQRDAPSFLLESVENGVNQARYSLMGAHPEQSIRAKAHTLTTTDHRTNATSTTQSNNPVAALRADATHRTLHTPKAPRFELPEAFLGGWVGYAGYDTARYTEPSKLPFANAPTDDRDLDDLQFSFYPTVVLFDHATKLITAVHLAELSPSEPPESAYNRAVSTLNTTVQRLRAHDEPMTTSLFDTQAHTPLTDLPHGIASTLTRAEHARMVERAREYIAAGDIFQVVLGQRLAYTSNADPFDVYRALRVINPSPYMGYIQGPDTILVAASPEILCRVRRQPDGTMQITNRPLAGTRRRGDTPDQDRALEQDLLADDKERAEHAMLVDLGRNDVSRVATPASTTIDSLMHVERYSHVMHIASTVTATLREDLDAWDALAATLPVGTISGAPKIRAMQIIDELEPVKRGPYGGGFGHVALNGEMDLALTLRTIVVPTAARTAPTDPWTYHLQAAGGIVADSKPEPEYLETLNKAAGPLRAVQLAERWLTSTTTPPTPPATT